MEPYQYKRLQPREIRVLWLNAGQGDAPLGGRLEIAPIDRFTAYRNNPRANLITCPDWFMALSYCWGDSSTPFSLPTPDGTLTITASLRSAFQRVRLSECDRPIWADGICINQNDTSEKEQQILLMREVYTSAYAVIADIGHVTPTLETALDLIKTFFLHAVRSGLNIGGTPLTYQRTLQFLGLPDPPLPKGPVPADDDPAWAAVTEFLCRPYFRRVWIIQEFVLAAETTMLLGDVMMDWQAFSAMFETYNGWCYPMQVLEVEEAQEGQRSIANLGMTRRMWMARRYEAMTLHDLLERFASHRVSLARDRYFGLLALARDGGDEGFRPDYTASFEEVVRQVGWGIMKGERGREMLMVAGMSTAPERFPSWVADYREDASRFGYNWNLEKGWNATLDLKFDVALDNEENDVIRLQGCMVDVISAAVQHWKEYCPATTDFLQWIPSYLATCAALFLESREEEPYVAGGSALEACWRTSIGGITQGRETDYGPVFSVLHKTFLTSIPLQQAYEQVATDTEISVAELRARAESFNQAAGIAAGTFQRSPALSQKGYYCLVPESCKIGDQLWLVKGCRLPLVLRASTERPGKHRLVGSGYMEGVMKGEALQWKGFQFVEVSLY